MTRPYKSLFIFLSRVVSSSSDKLLLLTKCFFFLFSGAFSSSSYFCGGPWLLLLPFLFLAAGGFSSCCCWCLFIFLIVFEVSESFSLAIVYCIMFWFALVVRLCGCWFSHAPASSFSFPCPCFCVFFLPRHGFFFYKPILIGNPYDLSRLSIHTFLKKLESVYKKI